MIFRALGKVSYCTWDEKTVIYNLGSGNTYLIENVPTVMLDYCFGSNTLGLGETMSIFGLSHRLNNEYEKDFLNNALNHFIKMDLLERIE